MISIILNGILFALKFWAGIVSGSLALKADAWHTLSDSVSSVIVLLGVKLSGKKADRKHPYGHGRWEQITALFIAFFLAIIAYGFLKDSIIHLREHTTADFGTIALVVTIVSILVKEGLAQYAFYLFRKTGNSMIKADGWHHRSDAFSSVVVLAGILLKDYFWWIDGVLGIAIALLLFYATWEIARDGISRLLGETPDKELMAVILKVIREAGPTEADPHHFHMHTYANHIELTFHIRLEEHLSIGEGHAIATCIEIALREQLGIESTIHVEPR